MRTEEETMIEIEVSKASAICVGGRETLTSGRIGLGVKLGFSPDWRGLIQTAVCEGSGRSIEVVVGENGTFTVPHECMAEAGSQLQIGVCGMNADGTVVIPTVYCTLGVIQKGAVPSGETGAEPTPSVFSQMLVAANQAVEAAQTAKDEAEQSADTAKAAALAASVENGQFVSLYIGEDGRLYFVRTENTEDVSMEITEDGRLVMEIG
jgi:hypothetical protein